LRFKKDKIGGNMAFRLVGLLLLLGLIAVFPYLFADQYFLHVVIMANIIAMFALSWNLISGYMGLVNFGQCMFFGAGAYLIGFLTKAYNISPPIGILLGGLAAVLLSLIVGIPCLRFRGAYYSIATLGFSQVLFTLSLALPKITGGEEGIHGIPKFIQSVEGNYYFSFLLLLLSLGALTLLLRSRFGKRFISIREDERLSEAAGIDTSRCKINGTAISAFVAGVAGAYFCYYQTQVTPDVISEGLTFSGMAAVVFGGLGTLFGPILGAYVLTFLDEYLYFLMDYRLIVYPLVIMLMLIFSPSGIFGLLRGWIKERAYGNPSGSESNKKL